MVAVVRGDSPLFSPSFSPPLTPFLPPCPALMLFMHACLSLSLKMAEEIWICPSWMEAGAS